MQAIQVLISSARALAALLTQSGSASKGRAIETKSATPSRSNPSATAGSLILFVTTTGNRLTRRMRSVTNAKAARGTMPAIVGTRASCQPIPVLISVAPASANAASIHCTSAKLLPCSTRSRPESLKIRMKLAPTARRVRRTISSARRPRFSIGPPHSSLRGLVRGAMN